MKKLMLTAIGIASVLGLSSSCAFAATTPKISHTTLVTISASTPPHFSEFGVRPIW